MKNILGFIFVLINCQSFSQTSTFYSTNNAILLKPEIYLDSILINLDECVFDSDKIKSIDIMKGAGSNKVYIKTKDPKNISFLSYATFKNDYFAGIDKPILFLINGQFVKNFVQIKIDANYIYHIEVESGEDYNELKKIYPSYAIINIKLKNVNNSIGERLISLDGMPSRNTPQ